MRKTIKRIYLFFPLMLCALLSPTLHAHLIPKQHGTLNVVDNDGVYLALSLPVSAFDGIDEDKNNLISMIEFNKHRASIVSRIKAGIVLSEKDKDLLLQGIMLSPVPIDEHSTNVDDPISRIYVMGKFVLNSSIDELHFRNNIYGVQPAERTFKISVKRKINGQKQSFKLTPEFSTMELFPETKVSTNLK